jgi:hypothetical protein
MPITMAEIAKHKLTGSIAIEYNISIYYMLYEAIKIAYTIYKYGDIARNTIIFLYYIKKSKTVRKYL